ncbi:hypothetical protein LSAT2_014216 [Lamellibrachia satsuma]|nr:hypothetical protein LSAT2_014216 [Lamellibrachia satsuma]
MTVVEPLSTSVSHIVVRPINPNCQPDLSSPQSDVVSPVHISVQQPVDGSSDHGQEKGSRLGFNPSVTGTSSGDSCNALEQTRSPSWDASLSVTPPAIPTADWYVREETSCPIDVRPWSPKPPGYVHHTAAAAAAAATADHGSETTSEDSIDDKSSDYLILGFIVTVFGNVVFGMTAMLLSVMARNAKEKGMMWQSQKLSQASLWMSLAGLVINIGIVVTVLGVLRCTAVHGRLSLKMALVTPTRDTPRSSTQTSQIGRPTSYAWVEQIETLPESSQDPVSSFKALKPGYSKPPYLFDPTLPDFINDGGATGQGSPIIVYTRAFNRPADYMMLALVHFLCLNPITGTAALCLSVASMRAAERGDLAEARRLGVHSLWISSAVIFTFFVISIVCMVLYVQMRGGAAVDGK